MMLTANYTALATGCCIAYPSSYTVVITDHPFTEQRRFFSAVRGNVLAHPRAGAPDGIT